MRVRALRWNGNMLGRSWVALTAMVCAESQVSLNRLHFFFTLVFCQIMGLLSLLLLLNTTSHLSGCFVAVCAAHISGTVVEFTLAWLAKLDDLGQAHVSHTFWLIRPLILDCGDANAGTFIERCTCHHFWHFILTALKWELVCGVKGLGSQVLPVLWAKRLRLKRMLAGSTKLLGFNFHFKLNFVRAHAILFLTPMPLAIFVIENEGHVFLFLLQPHRITLLLASIKILSQRGIRFSFVSILDCFMLVQFRVW